MDTFSRCVNLKHLFGIPFGSRTFLIFKQVVSPCKTSSTLGMHNLFSKTSFFRAKSIEIDEPHISIVQICFSRKHFTLIYST